MTDEQIPGPDFDDPAYDAIRGLLSDSRVDGPIPVDVAARLDATLAELTGRPSSSGGDPADEDRVVVPLRRRLAPRLLAAAAVVLVAGAGAFGLNRVLQDSTGTADSATAGVHAEDSGTKATAPASTPVPAPAQPQTALGATTDAKAWLSGQASVPVLTTASFAKQAAALQLRDFSVLTTAGAQKSSSNEDSIRSPSPTEARNFDRTDATVRARLTALAARRCPGPRIAGTASYPIVLDGKPSVLVVSRPAKDGSRLVGAWSCDGSRVLAFTTVPG